jgi:autoinducer 2-degrading protein
MAVTYSIVFHIAPSRTGDFHRLLGGVLDAMRGEETFLQAVLHADPADPLRFMLYETWQDHEEVLAVQVHRPYRAEWHAALEDILSAPRDISMWTPLRDDRKG